MNQPSEIPTNTNPAPPEPGNSAAVLLLDARGRITLASEAAGRFWQAGPAELAGEFFPSLFAFEVVSQEPDWLEAQWEVLLAAAAKAPLKLAASPKEGAPRQVEVSLAAAAGGSGGYFALVRPAAGSTPAAGHDPADLPALLAEKGPAGFFDLNFQENKIYYAPAWKKLLGYSDRDIANSYESWLQLIHPDDSAAAPDKVAKKYFSGARPFSLEFRMRHKQGHYVWLQSLGLQFFGAEGRLERVAGLHLDITERKEIEETSFAHEERFGQLTGPGPLGAFDLDFARNRFWFSAAWKKLLGYGEQELGDGADTLPGVLPPEAAPNGLAASFLAKPGAGPAYLELSRLRHKDGRLVTLLGAGVRQVSRKGELLRVLGFHCALPGDFSAGPDAQPAALLTAALAEAHEGMLLADAQGRVVHLNAQAAKLLGVNAEAARGQPVFEIFRLVRRTDGEPAENPCDRILTEGAALPLNDTASLAPSAGGDPVPVVWSARPVQAGDGRITGVVIVFRNPGEMSLTPEELIRANRFESLGQLAGGIAHDFNNLLTTILGGVSLAKDNKDYTSLEGSEQACLAAKGLTKQLLTFAKGGAGTQQIVEPAEILAEAVRLAAAGSTARIEVSAPPGLATISVDRAQILQVFQNLIINALQAMPEPSAGRIWIRAANTTLAENQVPPLPPGGYVEIEIRDNGAGIPPESLQKIFDAFFTTKKTGTGLGLATVLALVRRHGGQIGVESTVGQGTAFTVFLPRADRPAEVQARRAPSLRFGTGRVLFMDDDEKICHLTGGMLESLEYKYDTAKNGEEAIALYTRYLNIGRPYDAVIMDLTIIGGLGGEETFKRLRALDPDVRAIVSSGYDDDDMARDYLAMGFCGYLTKPYRVADLGRILKKVLE